MNLPNRPRLPIGLLGSLALILCVEGFVASHPTAFRHPWGWDWHLADRAARGEVNDCQILCFGDSLMKFGMSPHMITKRTGLKAYNLAVCAGEMPGSYFLFRRAIDAGARPRAVLIEAAPHLLARSIEENLIWPELLSYRDCLDIAVESRSAHFLASMGLAELTPSIRDRYQIRGSVMASIRGEPTTLIQTLLPSYLRNWNVNRGGFMTNYREQPQESLIPSMSPDLFPASWQVDRTVTHYVHEFLKLADDRGIRVYWLIPPLLPEVQLHREALGLDAKYFEFVRSLQARFPSLTVLDATRSGYGYSEHIDPIHLDSRGALCLSRDVGDVLRRDSISVARWVSLPAFRDIPPEIEVEDLSGSIIAERERTRK